MAPGLGRVQATHRTSLEVVTRPDECLVLKRWQITTTPVHFTQCSPYACPGSQLLPKTCGVNVISSIPEDTKAKDLSVCDLMH